jgi:hypothetical protein
LSLHSLGNAELWGDTGHLLLFTLRIV